MTWTIGMGEIDNIGRQCSEPRVALIDEAGVKLIYVGCSPTFGSDELFEYQDEYVKEFSLFASRLNENEAPTDVWRVYFRDSFIIPLTKDDGYYPFGYGFVVTRKAPQWDGIVTPKLIARIKTNIRSALLSYPAWPFDYGRPDIPARSVEFIPDAGRRRRPLNRL